MKITKRICSQLSTLLVVTALAGLLTPQAKAALIAYEGFDYTPGGTSLNTLNGGTGWTSAWDNGGWRTPNTGFSENEATLSFSNLVVGGTAARGSNDNSQSFRQFGTQAATGTYWISMLMTNDIGENASSSFGLSLFNGGSEQNFIGKAGVANWGVAGQGGATSGLAASTNTTAFLVSRYDMGAGVAHHWVNSTPGAVDPTNASAFNGVGGTAFTAFAFDRIRLGRFNTATGGTIDEFRLGTSYTDVAPIPEPSTYALLALGLGALVFLRRRCKA